MKVIDKKPDEGAPKVLDMHEQDAQHAVGADPDRYQIVTATAADIRAELRSRMSIDQRVSALETAIDALNAEDEPGAPAEEAAPETPKETA